MTLHEFVEKLKADYNLKHSVAEIELIVVRHAKQVADGTSYVAIDEDTVKDWIINSDSEEVASDQLKQIHSGNGKLAKEAKKEPAKKPEPKPKEKKEGEKHEFEQIGLFDL